jgi:nucleotide-binding universal stress UspA family protein
MPSTIVCGVDTSDAAGAVADTANWLARTLDARLLVLHVTEEPTADGVEFLASLRDRLNLPAEDVRQAEGAPADRLLEAVEQDGAELLVVGSRGRGPIHSAVFGSVSRQLATDAGCPVVVVPPGTSAPSRGESDGASIVCGVDGSDHSTATAQLAGELARRMGYRLVVVHALANLRSYASYPGARGTAPGPSAQPDTAERLAREIVDGAAAAAGGDATGVVETGAPWDVLQGVADREDGQLLVVAARGLSAARAAVFGSVATELATNGRYPVAIVPEAAELGFDSPDAG